MLGLAALAVSLHCINAAARQYNIPAKLIIAVLEVERGQPGKIVKNKNGTYDIGPMAINSLWLPELKKHGITEQDILYDACKNSMIGTWILSKKIAASNDLLIGIGNYNSHHYSFNKNYYNKVKISYKKTMLLLSKS
jgi:soluble lytic murein transglycosylase-like protein